MILRLAAPVVHHDALAEPLADEDRRRRRQQERPVGRAEDVHDIVPRQPAQQRGHIGDRRGHRPHVLHALQLSQQGVRPRVVRQEVHLQPRHRAQSLQQPLRRDRLPAENRERWRNETHADRPRPVALRCGSDIGRRLCAVCVHARLARHEERAHPRHPSFHVERREIRRCPRAAAATAARSGSRRVPGRRSWPSALPLREAMAGTPSGRCRSDSRSAAPLPGESDRCAPGCP